MKKIVKYYLIVFYVLFKSKDRDEKAVNSAIYYYCIHWIIIGGILLVITLKIFPEYKSLQSEPHYKTYFEWFKLVLGAVIFMLYLYFFEKLKHIIVTEENKDLKISPTQKWICYLTLPFLIAILIFIIKVYNY